MTTRRRLIVMRHGKAEPFAATDHERVLTGRGVRSAADAGRHLDETGTVPDYAVVSSATRTRQTWQAVAETTRSDAVVSFDGAVYTGSADVVLDALREVPTQARVVIFVGHNPSAAYVANQLDDGDGAAVPTQHMLLGFPPGALAVLDVGVPWAELGQGSGRVVDFYVGKG